MAVMAKKLGLSVSRISRLIAAAEAVKGGAGVRGKTSYLPVATPSNADGKMEVAAQGDADETLGQGFSKLGARGSDGQP